MRVTTNVRRGKIERGKDRDRKYTVVVEALAVVRRWCRFYFNILHRNDPFTFVLFSFLPFFKTVAGRLGRNIVITKRTIEAGTRFYFLWVSFLLVSLVSYVECRRIPSRLNRVSIRILETPAVFGTWALDFLPLYFFRRFDVLFTFKLLALLLKWWSIVRYLESHSALTSGEASS